MGHENRAADRRRRVMAEKMDRLFRFDMYPADWLLDTSKLSFEQHGIFATIIMLIYAKRGPIPNDPEEIARKAKGCSIRKARALIQELVELGFITLSAGNLSQKRAEVELNLKRTHLESSAKGGRNKHENEARNKENKDLNSSDPDNSLSTSTPPPSPTATAKPPKAPKGPGSGASAGGLAKPRGSGGGAFKQIIPEINPWSFAVMNFLTDDHIAAAKANAPGWDLRHLAGIYDEGIRKGDREPPNHPGPAFAAWCKKYTKGKRP